jgi:hypothetical protein
MLEILPIADFSSLLLLPRPLCTQVVTVDLSWRFRPSTVTSTESSATVPERKMRNAVTPNIRDHPNLAKSLEQVETLIDATNPNRLDGKSTFGTKALKL